MDRKNVVFLLVGFFLGILLSLSALKLTEPRYVPFGTDGNRILDTRNGNIYGMGDRATWVLITKF